MASEPLLGREEAVIDEKGRVRISRKKQDRLGRNFVLHQDPIGCLVAYPLRIWRQKLFEVLSIPASRLEREIALRDTGSMAEDEINCDAQARFVIPQRFRQALGLDREVYLVGCVDRVEIWAKAEYEKFLAAKAKHSVTRREAAERGVDFTGE